MCTRAFSTLFSISTQQIMCLLVTVWEVWAKRVFWHRINKGCVWVLRNLILWHWNVYEGVLHALLHVHTKNYASTHKTLRGLGQKSPVTPHQQMSCGSCVTLSCIIDTCTRALPMLYSIPIQKIMRLLIKLWEEFTAEIITDGQTDGQTDTHKEVRRVPTYSLIGPFTGD